MSTRLTASQLDRAAACPASFALPAVAFPPSDASARGTEIHRFLEAAVTRGREAALLDVPEDAPWRATCEGIDTGLVTGGAERVECEVKFAYKPQTDTARQLSGGARDYAAAAGEIAGTVDLIVTREDGTTAVVDYKTGRQPVHAAESGQMRLLGLAVARARGLEGVCVSIVRVIDDGTLGFDEVWLGPDDLDRIARHVRSTVSRVAAAREAVSAGVTPDVAVGNHCVFCPAYRACPANIGLAKEVLTSSGMAENISELSPSQAGAVWEWTVRARRVLEEIEQGLRAYVDNEPIPLPDGINEVARVESVREGIDGRAAVPVLEAYLGPAACEVIEPSVSKARLEKFVRAEAPSPMDARDMIRQVMAGLRRAGAVKETTSVSYRTRPLRFGGARLMRTEDKPWFQPRRTEDGSGG